MPTRKDVSLSAIVGVVTDAFWRQFSNNNADAWVQEVFQESVIAKIDGEYYEVPWGRDTNGNITFGEPKAVNVVYQPKELSGLTIMKDAKGDYRWFAWVSNRYRDIDSPPEIISEKAHQRFIARAEKSGQYPELRVWHVPGSRIGVTDWLDYDDGFLVASGTFDKGMDQAAERLANATEPLATSHGFKRLAHDPDTVVTDDYHSFEVSVLPAGYQANPWTEFQTFKEDDMGLSPKKKEFLLSVLPADTVEALEKNTKALRKAAEEAGVDWKEVEKADKEEATTETVTEPTAETDTKPEDAPAEDAPKEKPEIDAKALAESMIEHIVATLDLKALSDEITALKEAAAKVPTLEATIASLTEQVKGLQVADDEKQAKAITPRAVQHFSWMHGDASPAASKSRDTLLTDSAVDEALKASGPSAIEAFMGKVLGRV